MYLLAIGVISRSSRVHWDDTPCNLTWMGLITIKLNTICQEYVERVTFPSDGIGQANLRFVRLEGFSEIRRCWFQMIFYFCSGDFRIFYEGVETSHQLLWWIVEVSERVWITRLFHHSIAPIFEVLDKNPVTLTFHYISKGWISVNDEYRSRHDRKPRGKSRNERRSVLDCWLLFVYTGVEQRPNQVSIQSNQPIWLFKDAVCSSFEWNPNYFPRSSEKFSCPSIHTICTEVFLCQRWRSDQNPGYLLYNGRVYCPFISSLW